ncbi:MAG: hypothetical protein Q3983_04795 [Capnocytophaga sp.]|nr:hypothetical protein [Capnocytophaga sp.]
MKKVLLSLIGMTLLSSCLKEENNNTPQRQIRLLSKTIETPVATAPNQYKITTEQSYEYGQFGNLVKRVEKVTNANGTTVEDTYENKYEGILPIKTTHSRANVTLSETTYEYYNNGKLKIKSEVEGNDKTNPITDEYDYDGDLIKKHTHIHRNGQKKNYSITEYTYTNNQIKVAVTSYTEENNQKTNEVKESYVYLIDTNNTIKEITKTGTNETTVISYMYDNKQNPLFLNTFYKMTNPTYYLEEEYFRYNITKKTLTYSNKTLPKMETEFKYNYDEDGNPIRQQKTINQQDISTKIFSY